MANLVQLPSRHLSMTSSSNPFNRPLPSFRNSSTLQFYAHRTPYPVHHRIIAPTIKCMANPRRVKMVAKQIRRELSDMLLTDKNLQYAVLPEAALGADRYLSSLATISDVEVSADLQVRCLFCVRETMDFFFVAEVFDALSAGYNRVLSSIYARVVKVYVSVFGDQRGREVAISGLKSKSKYVRSQLGKRMKLRLTPEVRFIEDESLERGSRVIAILDKIKNENEMKVGESDGKKEAASELHSDGEDWEEEGVDEDIIYVD